LRRSEKFSRLNFENGIFHNGPSKDSGELASIRQSYNEKDKYERIVIDFKGNEVPRIYGSFQSQEKKIYIDLFKSYLLGNFSTISSTRYVEKVHFYPIEKDHVSVELWLKDQVVIEVFSLQNPGRLVIDLKK
jgi:hypothetical protein